MKKICVLLFVLIIAGCKLRPDKNVTTHAAIHFAGIFITNNIPSDLSLRIKTADVISDTGDIYHVSGLLEGYSSYNAPMSVEHYTETLHFLGGNPNDSAAWDCTEIYVGKKKLK